MPSAAADDDGIAVAESGELGAERAAPPRLSTATERDVAAARAEHDDAAAHARERVELGLQAGGVRSFGAGCREDESARALAAQRADEPHLALRIALGDRDRDDEPRLVGAACDAGGELAEVRVGDVGDQQRDDRRRAARRRLGGEVRGVAELRGGGLDALAVALGHLAGRAVEHARGGRQRHAGLARDVVQGCRASGRRA